MAGPGPSDSYSWWFKDLRSPPTKIEMIYAACIHSTFSVTGTATCRIFGDPHFQTFDGVSFDFQGACRYTASKSCTDDTHQYHVIVNQEKRGGWYARFGDRVTYVGYMEVIVDGRTVRLMKEGRVEVRLCFF